MAEIEPIDDCVEQTLYEKFPLGPVSPKVPKYTEIKHRNFPQPRVFFYVFRTFLVQIASIFDIFVVCSLFLSLNLLFFFCLLLVQFLWSSFLLVNEARTVNQSDVVPQIAFASQSSSPLDYEYSLFPQA